MYLATSKSKNKTKTCTMDIIFANIQHITFYFYKIFQIHIYRNIFDLYHIYVHIYNVTFIFALHISKLRNKDNIYIYYK